MGFFSEDMVPMLGVYEAETSELIAKIDAIVLNVERSREFTNEDIAELFRCAHTIKGSSAMMGLDSLSELTHKVEDLFDILRGDPSLSDGHVADILDHLYSFSDFVKDEIGRMEEPDFAPTDAGELIGVVGSYAATLTGVGVADTGAAGAGASGGAPAGAGASGASSAGETGETPQGAIPGESPTDGKSPDGSEGARTDEGASDAAGQDENGATLKVGFKPDVPMVNARAMVILKQLGGQVKVLSYVPDDLSNAETARIIAEDGLLVVVDAADAEKAKQFLAKNSFIRRITVLDEATLAPSAPTADKADRNADAAPSADKFIKLRWSSVREMQDMVGEFLLRTRHLKALCSTTPDENELRSAVSQTARLVDELVYHIDKMAMVSMSALVPQLSRMVRDMCRSSGKQVSFEVHGGDIEIDRNLYNSISDPLLHIVRNAVDHGIESPEERLAAGKDARGTVKLSIQNLGARVMFRVSDDGRGIDADEVLAKAAANNMLEKPASSYTRSEILQMVMLAGLSTSKEITQYSGRGVGMDVVSTVVRDFNGRVEIESEPGTGTTMSMFMPVSVTSVECLCFRIGPSVYPMPLLNLNKIFTADEAAERLSSFEGSTLFDFEKCQIPVLDMHRLLDCQGENAFYIVCHSMDDEFVIGVDDVLGDFSCANKALPPCLDSKWQAACPIRNVAVMDDGTVGYVLNAPLLADLAQGRKEAAAEAVGEEADGHGHEDAEEFSNEVATLADVPSQAFVFTLGSDWYALPIELVERLIPLPTSALTPRSMPYLMGLASYRNQVIAMFDLAKSAGIQDASPYALVMEDDEGVRTGLAITSAIGIRDLNTVILAEEQPSMRSFAGGLRSVALLNIDPKDPLVTLLAQI